jgi:hypothetical protein
MKKMPNKQNKIFCGSGKVKSDRWLKITINPDKIKDYIQEYNGNKYIKLDINIKPEPDKYGKDVEVTVDTWKPDVAKPKIDKDDLPF